MLNLFKFLQRSEYVFPEGETRQSTRELEWFLARLEFGYGLWLVLPLEWVGSAMSGALYQHLLMLMPEHAWGWIFLLKGLFHALALRINGRRYWTPWVRAISCFISTAFLAALTGFMVTRPVLVPDFFIVFTGIGSVTWAGAMYNSGLDAVIYWSRRHGKFH